MTILSHHWLWVYMYNFTCFYLEISVNMFNYLCYSVVTVQYFIHSCRRCGIIQNRSRKEVLITIKTPTDLTRYPCYATWLSSSTTLDCLNVSQCEKLSRKCQNFISQHEFKSLCIKIRILILYT